MGRFTNTLLDVLFVGTVVASGVGEPFGGNSLFAQIELDVTAMTGSGGKLNVTIEESFDETHWFEFAAFKMVAGPDGELVKGFNPAQFLRARWTVNGMDVSFTFEVKCSRRIIQV